MKKRLLSSALFVLLLLTLPGAAELAVRNQPVRTAPTTEMGLPTDNPWVSVHIDERMFTLFAALNAAGYDQDNFGEDYHPVRQLVRERLAGKNFSGLGRLRAELKFVDSYNFVVWALHYGGPPDFARQEHVWAGDGMPASLFFGMDGILRNFYRKMEIGSLWQEVRPQYEQEAVRYQKAAGPAIQAALDYTRLNEVPLQRVVVIPNLLEAHWRGNGPHVGDTAYVVVGPTGDQPALGLVQHEALHSIVGPLVEANLDAIVQEQATALYTALRPRVPGSYGTWESIIEESVVRALDARLAGPEWEENSLRNDEQAGFRIVRLLAETLKTYEQGSGTLADFMPRLLQALNQVDPQSL